jgi:iron complex outermembrane receptor protein
VPGHAIVGARLGVRSPDKRWSIAVFARNLFDDRAPVFLYAPYLLANTTAPGVTAVGRSYSTDSFRLVGVTLDGRF